MLCPVTVTDDRDLRVVAWRFLLRQKCTAARQWNTEDGEIVRGDDGTEGAARIAFLTQTNQGQIEAHYVTENRVLLADIEISGIRKTAEFLWILLVLRKELHHFVRLGVRGRGKEKGVYQAEHSGVHANPEREHSCRCNCKPRRLEQLPEGKFEIANHSQALWPSAITGSLRVARIAGM